MRRLPRDGTLKHLADLAPGFELWKTGWSEPFTSYPDNGYYDELQYRRAIFLLGKTMHPGWKLGNGYLS
jgi:hypothetical protein